ncbi:MAG: hypothetical protein RDU59_02640 [Thermodesulfobacteriota bacterium]|nr:hypothetical protein [Thermodesulfobacteriota bacterium]
MNKTPLLYYRTIEQIKEYRKRPALQKIKWLEAQMEFFYYAMPDRAKKIRDRMRAEKKTATL